MVPAGSGSELISDLFRLVWQVIALAAGYGIITMVILQGLQDVWFRQLFNRARFDAWFEEMKGADADKKQMIWLAAAGDADALFSLPIDKMAGQIGIAANAVLESPYRYANLIRLLGADSFADSPPAAGAPPASIPPSPAAPPVDEDLKLLTETTAEQLKPADSKDNVYPDLQMSFADARTRVSHRVQRRIDLLQLRSTQRWRTESRVWSLFISTIIGMAPLYLRSWLAGHYGIFGLILIIPSSILLSVLGGLLAPFLRNLAAHQARSE